MLGRLRAVRLAARVSASLRQHSRQPQHQLHCSMRWMSTQTPSDDDDFMDLGDFDEIGLTEADVGPEYSPTALDPKSPPDLSYEHYQQLKGINFADRADLLRAKTEESREDWQNTLEDLRNETETKFEFEAFEQERIQDQVLPEEEDEFEELGDIGRMPDDELASRFGQKSPLGEEDDGLYEDVKAPLDEFYDPGAFPMALGSSDVMLEKKKPKCIFCLPDPSRNHVKEIKYSNVQLLHKFINERGMITSRRYNFNCAKHQRKLARAVKQARYIGLLSYTDNFYAPESFSLDNTSIESMNNQNFGDVSKLFPGIPSEFEDGAEGKAQS